MKSEAVFSYHERTKHRPERSAPAPGTMDWANQPEPFRFYRGAEVTRFDPESDACGLSALELFAGPPPSPAPVTTENLGRLLRYSIGLAAWKSYQGAKWALRVNPSSGNLHPLEAYVLMPEEKGFSVSHYSPFLHGLEALHTLDGENAHDTVQGFPIVLTAIHWREAWKYGERAFRYTHLDTGHALSCLTFAARMLGWTVQMMDGIGSDTLARLLNFDRIAWPGWEEEKPVCLLWFGPEQPGANLTARLEASVPNPSRNTPNILSANHRAWEAIDTVDEATELPSHWVFEGLPPAPMVPRTALTSAPDWPSGKATAEALLLKRRSAQGYNKGTSRISLTHFKGVLESLMPGNPPFPLLRQPPAIDLLFYVHNVEGLPSGLYLLLRTQKKARLMADLKRPFLWEEAMDDLPFYFLEPGDMRRLARMVSCNQEIAGDGAFALSMLADFEMTIQNTHYQYPLLHWEAGMIGQSLYLTAEMAGLAGTGIGCFFDDLIHEHIGLEFKAHQALYNFTVGAPVRDARITTLRAHAHLEER